MVKSGQLIVSPIRLDNFFYSYDLYVNGNFLPQLQTYTFSALIVVGGATRKTCAPPLGASPATRVKYLSVLREMSMIKILRVDLHFSPNSSYIFIHVYCKLLITNTGLIQLSKVF